MAARQKWNVAVMGALGMVGTEMIKTLERRDFPVEELRPLDVAQYVGQEVTFKGRTVEAGPANADNFTGIDIALFSAGGAASLELAPQAVAKGAVVIDNSAAWRMDPDCPLVVPEVNPGDLDWHQGIIANPNCFTIQMVVALKQLHHRVRIQRIVVSTYQATSGAGKKGTLDLENQVREYVLEGRMPDPAVFTYPIAFNLIPQIDVFLDGGYTKEEIKMANETRKIIGDQTIKVTATCVRVPVFFGHSESVNIQTGSKITAEQARSLLRTAPGVTVIDDPQHSKYPMPALTEHTDSVYVGRIREDNTITNGLNLWIVADNVRKGAALNAVQIAEELVRRDLVRVN